MSVDEPNEHWSAWDEKQWRAVLANYREDILRDWERLILRCVEREAMKLRAVRAVLRQRAKGG